MIKTSKAVISLTSIVIIWFWLYDNHIINSLFNDGKGYRIYFKETDGKIIILLIGGDKSTQQKDIEKAKAIWDKLKK